MAGATRIGVRRHAGTILRVATEDVYQLGDLGAFIRAQRKAAAMSLRELAAAAGVSNPYISQIERGLHEPSMRVMRGLSSALGLPLDTLLERAGLIDIDPDEAAEASRTVESAISSDPNLTPDQQESLLAVYRSYVAANER